MLSIPHNDPPYVSFVIFGLGALLSSSVVLFGLGESIANHRWNAPVAAVLSFSSGVVLARFAVSRWRHISASEAGAGGDLKRARRFLLTALVLVLLMMSGSISVGLAIGENRVEAAELSTDLERMKEVGARISKARNDVERTIPSYVQMYRGIEPEVADLEATFERLKKELTSYDARFPSQHEQTASSIASMEIGLRRTALLKQQIEVAKALSELPTERQSQTWQAEMQPLLTNESALGNESSSK